MEFGSEPEVAGLVDHKRGLINPAIFAKREIYQREMEQIFGRCWLFIGHESQVAKVGDFTLARMGEESLILCHAKDGSLSAFLNLCPTCSSLLSRADGGNTSEFNCAYHGWSFDLKGHLLVEDTSEDGAFNATDDLLLFSVPQLDTYKGCIFATFDKEAPPLDVFLGDIRWGLDLMLDQANLKVASVGRWTIKCNWKFAAESSVNDIYHGQVHLSALHADIGEGAEARRAHEFNLERPGFTILTEYGHGLNAEEVDETADQEDEDLLLKWRQNSATQRRLGTFRMGVQRSIITLFPNAMFSSATRELHIWNPRGVDETEVWLITFYDDSEPPEVRRAFQRTSQILRGPAGMYTQDESENWEQATEGSKAVVTSSQQLNYQMGLGRGEIIEDEKSPPRIETLINEHRQLWFYRNWAHAMSTQNWEDWKESRPIPTGTV